MSRAVGLGTVVGAVIMWAAYSLGSDVPAPAVVWYVAAVLGGTWLASRGTR